MLSNIFSCISVLNSLAWFKLCWHYCGPPLCPIIESFLDSQSSIAFLIESSANTEQCNLIGGNSNDSAISLSLISFASSIVLPFNISTNIVELAIALPQPYVLNFTSTIFSSSSSFNCNFITSPQAGAPVIPVATLGSFGSNLPTLNSAGLFRTLSKRSTTFFEYAILLFYCEVLLQ